MQKEKMREKLGIQGCGERIWRYYFDLVARSLEIDMRYE
jgi:hypothetical protein